MIEMVFVGDESAVELHLGDFGAGKTKRDSHMTFTLERAEMSLSMLVLNFTLLFAACTGSSYF